MSFFTPLDHKSVQSTMIDLFAQAPVVSSDADDTLALMVTHLRTKAKQDGSYPEDYDAFLSAELPGEFE